MAGRGRYLYRILFSWTPYKQAKNVFFEIVCVSRKTLTTLTRSEGFSQILIIWQTNLLARVYTPNSHNFKICKPLTKRKNSIST